MSVNKEKIETSENSDHSNEFVKFEKEGAFYEGKLLSFVKSKFGITAVFEDWKMLGLTEGLKRLFSQAIDAGLKEGDYIKIEFLDEKNNFKNFRLHLLKSGLKFDTKSYEPVAFKNVKKFL